MSSANDKAVRGAGRGELGVWETWLREPQEHQIRSAGGFERVCGSAQKGPVCRGAVLVVGCAASRSGVCSPAEGSLTLQVRDFCGDFILWARWALPRSPAPSSPEEGGTASSELLVFRVTTPP